ncbi:MAG: nuclear transport factor 2 family protein, partial [Saprospiraceae bacterium]|nr:nuclear transport factor 2 family protein [Saprospiraceae bacterium]
MKLNKEAEKEILQIYDTWLHSYLNGDIATYDHYLDDSYHFIGSTNNEEFLPKRETTKFFETTADQFAGKTEIRNSNRVLECFGGLVIITEVFDCYFLNDEKWIYYGRFRFSSVMEQKDEGWRFIYQHFSTPDAKTEEGDTIGYEKINDENLTLRKAIKRRTIELEQKNRQLQRESALEKIRAGSMEMQHSRDLAEMSKIFYQQLVELGIDAVFSYVWLPNEERGDHLFWATWKNESPTGEPYSSKTISYPLDKNEPYTAACFEAWASDEPVHENFIAPEEVLDFFAAWQELLEDASHVRADRFKEGIYYTEAYMKYGCFGINIRRQLQPEEKEIFHRIAVEFERTYTRFLDLKKAEEQAREKEIELGLEKVRARAMAMQSSTELSDLVDTVFKELTKLDFTLKWCMINIIDESTLTNMVWAANPDTNKAPESYHMKFEDWPFHHAMLKGYRERQAKCIHVLEGQEKKEYDEYLFNDTEFRKVPAEAQASSRAMEKYVVTWTFSNFGGLQTVGETPLSETSLDILSRFGKVFDLTYTRFNDLK